MKRSPLATPDTPIAVLSLRATWIGQCFSQSAPLHGEVFVVVIRGYFVNAPGEGAVVEDDIVELSAPGGISTIIDIFKLGTADSDKAHDDIVARQANGIISQGNALSRSSLSGNGKTVTLDEEIRFEVHITTHVKDNGAVAGRHGVSERTGSRVVEVGDMINRTVTSARGGVSGISLCPRKGRDGFCRMVVCPNKT